MKTRFCAALLLAALVVSIFSGCSANALQQLEHAEEALDHRLDRAEENLENRIESMITDSAVPAAPAPTLQTTPAESTPPAKPEQFPQTTPTESTLLTKEEVEKIALEHAGLSASQVQRLRTELDYDRNRAEYEVDFRVDRWEYDYDIDAQTGEIRSWDKDWDD